MKIQNRRMIFIEIWDLDDGSVAARLEELDSYVGDMVFTRMGQSCSWPATCTQSRKEPLPP